MLVDFDTLQDTARVWIYPCNRLLTEEERTQISADLKAYLSSWTVGSVCL